MLVRSRYESIEWLRSQNIALGREIDKWFGPETHDLHLHVGQTYVVYAVYIHRGWTLYYLAPEGDEADRTYPLPYFAALFDVVDPRVSIYWSLGMTNEASGEEGLVLAFEEWARDPVFYERLVDGSADEEAVFARYRSLIDAECADRSRQAAGPG